MTFQYILNWLRKIWFFLYRHTEGFLMAVFTVMLVFDVLLGILARYVRFEIVFSEELGKYIFIWLCAIGISAAAKDNQHIRISLVADRLPLKRKVSWVISQILFLIFTLFFFYWGLRLTQMHIDMGKSAMGFHFPMFIFTAALPIGFGISTIRLLIDIINCFKNSAYKPWDDQLAGGIAGISKPS